MNVVIQAIPVSCHEAALTEYRRLLEGTVEFSGMLHHIVDTDTRLCIATVGPGPAGAMNALLIVNALNVHFHKTEHAVAKARAVAADKERITADRTRLLVSTGMMLRRLLDSPNDPDIRAAAAKMLEPTR